MVLGIVKASLEILGIGIGVKKVVLLMSVAKYIPKFQVAEMSLEVAEIRFSNLVLQTIK